MISISLPLLIKYIDEKEARYYKLTFWQLAILLVKLDLLLFFQDSHFPELCPYSLTIATILPV